MIFSPVEIQKLFNIIDYRIAIMVGDALGKEFLTPQDKEVLKINGFDIDNAFKKIPPFYQAYLFGKVSGLLTPSQIGVLDYKDLASYTEKRSYLKLTKREQFEYNAAAVKTYTYVKDMGQKFKNTLLNSISEQESQESLVQQEIKEAIKEGVLKRRSAQAVASDLGSKLQDWNRDWGRIVETEYQNIYSIGKASTILEEHGPDALVYKQVFPEACSHCRHFYTTRGIGSKPRIFKLSELIENGSNVGKKVKDWKPTLPATHPWCRCELVYIPKGYVWSEDKKTFIPPENYKRVERKSKIKLTIGSKTFEV